MFTTLSPFAHKELRMKLYIAGPMAGYYNYNFSAFDRARDVLEDRKHTVISPADLDRKDGFTPGGRNLGGQWEVTPAERAWFLLRDLELLVGCKGIVLLDGWQESRGANVELFVAVSCGLEVFRFHGDSGVLRPSSATPVIAKLVEHLADVQTSEKEITV